MRRPLMLLAATWRRRWVTGEATLERLATERRPAIYAFWHQALYPSGHALYRFARRNGLPLAVLASLSRDGELMARMARAWGVLPVRGSTSRAGLSGLLALRRVIARQAISVVAAPDGPRGPARRCQSGIVALASASGAPLVPITSASDRCWRLRSWDRLMVPKPFARVAIAVGEPIQVAREASLEAGVERLQKALDELTTAAERELEG